jgi:DNA repair exonuclease SbcCD nuclease subunit
MSLPSRANGDTRLRIGLAHGSTFDIPGYTTNFPISDRAPQERGLDYLALGDTHSFREIPKGSITPIVYPSAPEPTSFSEQDVGYVALVWFTRQGNPPRIERERVARWTWRQVTVCNMAQLRALAADDLLSTVLWLKLELTVSLGELKELNDILASLKGTAATNARTGAFVCEPSYPSSLVVDPGDIDVRGLPDAVVEAVARLKDEGKTTLEARRALVILQRLLHEVR